MAYPSCVPLSFAKKWGGGALHMPFHYREECAAVCERESLLMGNHIVAY